MATATSLQDYSLAPVGGTSGTFAQLGVTAAKFVCQADAEDYAELTVDISLTAPNSPVQGLARCDVFAPGGGRVFSGYATQIKRDATRSTQQRQTFRIEGPSWYLRAYVYRQTSKFPVDPTNSVSAVADVLVPNVLFFFENYAAGLRVGVKEQIQMILDYAIAAGAPIAYAGLDAIPSVQPPEDYQETLTCADAVQRCLRWTPQVAMAWDYAAGTPTLTFSVATTVPASVLGGGGDADPAGRGPGGWWAAAAAW